MDLPNPTTPQYKIKGEVPGPSPNFSLPKSLLFYPHSPCGIFPLSTNSEQDPMELRMGSDKHLSFQLLGIAETGG